MVTLREILQLKFDTTALELTARDPEKLRLIQEFIICPDASDRVHRTEGLRNAWLNNTLVYVDRTINHHNEPTKRGPVMGWEKTGTPDRMGIQRYPYPSKGRL